MIKQKEDGRVCMCVLYVSYAVKSYAINSGAIHVQKKVNPNIMSSMQFFNTWAISIYSSDSGHLDSLYRASDNMNQIK